jgi:hypothetical protein
MGETGNKKNLADQIMEGLKAAATEIDELRVQSALGRAEAKAAFEELKKKLDQKITETRASVNGLKDNQKLLGLVNAFEFLQVQLALGIAETREAFNEQEKKITHALAELEAKIRSNENYQRHAGPLKMEVEKFKIKLELLALHYKLDKISMQEGFKEKKEILMARLDSLREKMIHSGNDNWEHFQEEISEAFRHLKKAFVGK